MRMLLGKHSMHTRAGKLNGMHHLAFDPFAAGGACHVNVAALVDFEKTSDGQAVVVNIADHVYFQYNRAKGFNNETRAMPNKLVVVESHGNGNSGQIAALGPSDGAFEILNFKESGRRLVIEVCSEELGDATKPDLMVVSIGFGESSCYHPLALRAYVFRHTRPAMLRRRNPQRLHPRLPHPCPERLRPMPHHLVQVVPLLPAQACRCRPVQHPVHDQAQSPAQRRP
jgi:hypothetical protein